MSETVVVPKHLGIILDGNRRWAKAQGLPVTDGHRRGLDVFKEISLAAFDKGIEYVSAYVFSTENWKRTQDEVSFLMGLVTKGVEKTLNEFHEANIKLVMLGSREGLDKKVLQTIDNAVETTKDNTRGTLALCFNYGGQQEIAEAAQKLAEQSAAITIDSLSQNIYVPAVPDVDFIIRTSGERRLSGFMLWRSTYAEMYFTDVLWPDFTVNDLDIALADYADRQRRFGS